MKKFITISLVLLLLPSCIAVPLLESARKAGFREGDRMSLLTERVEKFNATVAWDDPMPALAFVDDTGQKEMAKRLRKQKKSERIVDIKVDNIDFQADATEATVVVTVRAFKVPYYVVEERSEDQRWIFRAGGGWKLLYIDASEKSAEET